MVLFAWFEGFFISTLNTILYELGNDCNPYAKVVCRELLLSFVATIFPDATQIPIICFSDTHSWVTINCPVWELKL